MTLQKTASPASRHLLWAIAALVLARLISLGFYPLMDTTEARYGDIARRMVERSDWITPWFTDTEPFWGKPPLSFWASAFGFKVFHVHGGFVHQFVFNFHKSISAWVMTF